MERDLKRQAWLTRACIDIPRVYELARDLSRLAAHAEEPGDSGVLFGALELLGTLVTHDAESNVTWWRHLSASCIARAEERASEASAQLRSTVRP